MNFNVLYNFKDLYFGLDTQIRAKLQTLIEPYFWPRANDHADKTIKMVKNENLATNTTAASKYIHTNQGGQESASIEIPPFRPHFIKFQK